jgi:hypothetical protein
MEEGKEEDQNKMERKSTQSDGRIRHRTLHTCVRMHALTRARARTHTHTHTDIYIYIYTQTYTHIYMHTYMHACMHAYIL